MRQRGILHTTLVQVATYTEEKSPGIGSDSVLSSEAMRLMLRAAIGEVAASGTG